MGLCVICNEQPRSRALGNMCKRCNQRFLMLVAAHDYLFNIEQSIIEQIPEQHRVALSNYVEHIIEIRDTQNK